MASPYWFVFVVGGVLLGLLESASAREDVAFPSEYARPCSSWCKSWMGIANTPVSQDEPHQPILLAPIVPLKPVAALNATRLPAKLSASSWKIAPRRSKIVIMPLPPSPPPDLRPARITGAAVIASSAPPPAIGAAVTTVEQASPRHEPSAGVLVETPTVAVVVAEDMYLPLPARSDPTPVVLSRSYDAISAPKPSFFQLAETPFVIKLIFYAVLVLLGFSCFRAPRRPLPIGLA
jgi:hypothetical protein